MEALGTIGVLGFLTCLVWLIVAAIRKRPKRNSLIGMLITFVAFVVGMANSQSFQAGTQAGLNSSIASNPTISANAGNNGLTSGKQKVASRAPSSNTPSAKSSATSEMQPQEVYNDKLISVWFIKKYDVSYMPSMFYFDIKVDNKTDQKISVYPDDAYVNSTTFSVYSGEPMDIQPKTNRAHTFFGQYEGTGIKSSSQITKLGFKLYLTDENTHDINHKND